MRISITSKLPFRFLFPAALAFTVILSFAPQVSAYEEDTHFLVTYVICRSVGFTEKEALVIAAVDQGMDDSKDVNAHDGGIPQIDEEWLWHALDRDGDMRAAGIIARRDKLFKEALGEKDPENRLIRIGIFFHYQQDTWAHRHHEEPNHLSRDAFTTFNTPAGHGPWGSKPDRPPLDPVAALMSLEDGIGFASEFLRKGIGRNVGRFLANYVPAGGQVDEKWKDERRGKFFNRLDLSSEKQGSARHFLKSLINAQIDAYTRSRDYNPFFAPKKTPNKADLEGVRANLQQVCDRFRSNVGDISIPSREEKLAQGFTDMTTEGLLSLGASKSDDKATRQ
jgi:hypothetical protein